MCSYLGAAHTNYSCFQTVPTRRVGLVKHVQFSWASSEIPMQPNESQDYASYTDLCYICRMARRNLFYDKIWEWPTLGNSYIAAQIVGLSLLTAKSCFCGKDNL